MRLAGWLPDWSVGRSFAMTWLKDSLIVDLVGWPVVGLAFSLIEWMTVHWTD